MHKKDAYGCIRRMHTRYAQGFQHLRRVVLADYDPAHLSPAGPRSQHMEHPAVLAVGTHKAKGGVLAVKAVGTHKANGSALRRLTVNVDGGAVDITPRDKHHHSMRGGLRPEGGENARLGHRLSSACPILEVDDRLSIVNACPRQPSAIDGWLLPHSATLGRCHSYP